MALKTFAEELTEGSTPRPNIKKQLRQAFKNFREYSQFLKKRIDFEHIALIFYEGFFNFMIAKSYGTNTIDKVIKNVKIFMNEAVDRGYAQNLQFRNPKFKITEESAESIYLTRDEITRLYEMDLSGNLRLDKVRNFFVIECYTGLRFSNLSQLIKRISSIWAPNSG